MMEVQSQTSVEKYPAYKDSGVEWIGDIPEEWEVKRLAAFGKFSKGGGFSKSDIKTEGIGAVLYGDIYTRYGFSFKKAIRFVPPELADKSIEITRGDLLFTGSGETKEDIGKCVLFDGNEVTVAGGDVIIFKAKGNSSDFLKYILNSNGVKSEKCKTAKGEIIVHTYGSKLRDIYISIPPLHEQTAIANFLDEKTKKIDQAIAQKEKLIALLKERKQVIIQNAVTKGLDPFVRMKDSGIDWIGEIPEHWEVEKLFGVCHFVRGNSTFSKDELLDNGQYVALQYGKSYKVSEIDEKYEFYVNNEFYKDSQVVNHGDTIFISTSETIEDLGHTVYYKRNDLGLLGGEQMLLKPKREFLNSKYLHFSSRVFSKELRKYATGIKVFRFNVDDLKTIHTPIPPINEQNIIVQRVELELNKIDKSISLQQKQIEKLREYKSSLIDSAVTGKIKVS